MQNVYYSEIEAAYMRRRVQDAAAASGLAAQAASSSTPRRPFFPNLGLLLLRARDVFQRQQPVLRPLPSGRELPAT
jgi:hypothetical protein